MKSYTLYLEKDGEEVQVDLRLDIDGMIYLKNKFKETTIETISDAVVDIEKAVAIFDKSLNYEGNTNTIKKGKELYYLIVENDKGGMEGFWDVISNIARCSGILSGKMADKLDVSMQNRFDGIGMYADDEPGNAQTPQN